MPTLSSPSPPPASVAPPPADQAQLQALRADVLSLRAFMTDAVEERVVLMQQMVATHRLVQGGAKGVQGGATASSGTQTEQQGEQHPLDAVVQAEQDRAAAEQLAGDLRADNAALRASLLEMTQAYDEVSPPPRPHCTGWGWSCVWFAGLVKNGSSPAVDVPV